MGNVLPAVVKVPSNEYENVLVSKEMEFGVRVKIQI